MLNTLSSHKIVTYSKYEPQFYVKALVLYLNNTPNFQAVTKIFDAQALNFQVPRYGRFLASWDLSSTFIDDLEQ